MALQKSYEYGIVESYRANCASGFEGDRRLSFEEIDKQLYSSYKELQKQAASLDLDADTDASGLPLKIIPPNSIVYTNCAELSAYLVAVYVAKSSLIEIPDLPNAMNITAALKDKLNHDSSRHSWALELIKIIQNSVVYNYGAAELRLSAKRENVLRALNPFNCFYDPSVSADRVGSDALYAGYTEVVTLPTLYRLLFAGGEQWLTSVGRSLITDISALERISYLTASRDSFVGDYVTGGYGRLLLPRSTSVTDWKSVVYGMPDSTEDRIKLRTRLASGTYQLTTYYCRAMPEWLQLPSEKYGTYNGQESGQIPVFKMYILDHTYLMAVEPVVESHGMLPIMIGQVQTDTSGSPLTYSESLVPVQTFSAKLNAARVSALRRALSDRGLYDRSLIDTDAINDRNPTAQIPVNGHSMRELGKSIRDTYLHLPFDTSGVAQLMGSIGEVDEYASRISGNNPQMQGSHLPGNRTAGEAARVNSFGEGRFRVYSILFQQTLMTPFKLLLRSNLGDSTQSLTYYEPTTRRKQSVSPAEFLEIEPDLVMSDGLMPSSKMVSPDMLSSLITALIQIPELRATKDIAAAFDWLARAGGVEDFHKIPPPPQQQVAMQQQQQQQAAAPSGAQPPATQ